MSLTVHLARTRLPKTRLRSLDNSSPGKPRLAFAAVKSAAKGLLTLVVPILILGAIIGFKTWIWWPQGQ